jgi:hypothetical protein
VVYALITVEALIALATLIPKTTRFSAAAGLVLAAALRLIPENFDQIPIGHATDPNSAPLIALMRLALIAASVGPARRGPMGTDDTSGPGARRSDAGCDQEFGHK